MKTMDRRTILSSGALALASAATQSTPAMAQSGSKPIFSVPAITIPIVGEEGIISGASHLLHWAQLCRARH